MKPDPFPMEHLVGNPVESSRAYNQRRKVMALAMLLAIALLIALAVILLGCGGSPAAFKPDPPPPVVAPLSATDVANLVQAAATSANVDTMAIAVVDRGGAVLAVYDKAGVVPGATDIGNFGSAVDVNDLAVALARTGAYFSNDQAPLSSRTVRFISGIHFPPGVMFVSNAALYGIENTNRGCPFNAPYVPGQEFPSARTLDGSQPGLGIITGKADLDLYKKR